MKIVKKDLAEALRMVKGFCNPKSYPIVGKVLIDGPGQCIIATDMQTHAKVSLAIKDFKQKVVGEKPPVTFPDEEFTKDLKALKKPQLIEMCDDYGIDPGTKPKVGAMIEAIFTASEASAKAEAKLPAPETEVDEIFCVDPDHLLKIVGSEDTKTEDTIHLHVEEFEQAGDLLTEGMTATALAVGENFQRIQLADANEFPGSKDFVGQPSATINGNLLGSVAGIAPLSEKEAPPWKKIVLFDEKNKQMVCCDGARLHMLKHKFASPCNLLLPAKALITLSKLAKDKDIVMKVDKSGDRVGFEYGDMTVVTQNDKDGEFPDYMAMVTGMTANHKVDIDNEVMTSLIQQVSLIADGSASFTFDGGLNAEATNEAKGEFRRFDVPFLKGKVKPEITMGLNPAFLSDALKNLGKKVTISLTDGPIFLGSGKSFQAVVNPVQM